MAILTGKPSSLEVGTQSAVITLSKSQLISGMSIVDTYWADSTNWKSVVFSYTDATGSQKHNLQFYNGVTSTITLSTHARANGWTVTNISIFDFDSGVYPINRSAFPTAAEFDITMTAPIVLASYRYWRMTISSTYNGTDDLTAGSYSSCAEWRLKWGGVMNSLNPYTVTIVTTPIFSVLTAINDNDISGDFFVYSGPGVFLDFYVDLGSAQEVTDFGFAPQKAGAGISYYMPKDYIIQGSANGSTWFTVDSNSISTGDSTYGAGANQWQNGTVREFNIQ